MPLGQHAPRSVLMTADAVGGVWSYALDLARDLTGRGTRTVLAVLGPAPSVDQMAATAEIDGLTVCETGLPLDWTATDPRELLVAGRTLAGLADHHRVDLVHLNSPALAADAAFSVPLVVGCHSCVATWWAAVRGTALPPTFAWRTELVGRGYRAADRLVAPTLAFARATQAAYGLPAPPSVVHNGVALDERCTVAGTGTAGGLIDVLTAGRLWDEGKGLATLDEAAAGLDSPVWAAGPLAGPNGAEIVLHHVRPLRGIARGELLALFARRPIFVSPALYEPFGLAVLEAACAGCPLVLSDIGSFRELWDGAASFVPARDPQEARRAIRTLLSDAVLRDQLGAAAAERARSFGLARFGEGISAIYREVLATPRFGHSAAPRQLRAAS